MKHLYVKILKGKYQIPICICDFLLYQNKYTTKDCLPSPPLATTCKQTHPLPLLQLLLLQWARPVFKLVWVAVNDNSAFNRKI